MPNQINLPKGIQAILDEVYKQASVTSVLDSPASQLKPTQNVHEFCYPQMEVGGLGDYDRNSGYTSNSGVKLDWVTVPADYDRGTKIQVDTMDNQESFDLAFGQAANILIREHVAPEGDAYTFAKLCGIIGDAAKTETLADGAGFLASLLEASTAMDEAEVPTEGRYLFATPTLLSSVKALDTTKSREALDGFAETIKVPQSRFYTAIDLLSGRDGDEMEGGWRVADHYEKTTDTDVVSGKEYYTKSGDTYTKVTTPAKADIATYYEHVVGKKINFMIVHKPALIKFDRHVAGPTVISADMNPDADADIVKYRKYGVLDVYKNKRAGVFISHQ